MPLSVRMFSETMRQVSTPVTEFDSNLQQFCDELEQVRQQHDALGVAAPQCHFFRRIFVAGELKPVIDSEFHPPAGNTQQRMQVVPWLFINPVIVESEGEITMNEACLSMPGIAAPVTRAKEVVVDYQDIHGSSFRIIAEGQFAVCIQHEMEHLEGRIFPDNLKPLARKLLMEKWHKLYSRNERLRDKVRAQSKPGEKYRVPGANRGFPFHVR